MSRATSIPPEKFEDFLKDHKFLSYKKLGEKYGVSASSAYYLVQKLLPTQPNKSE